MKFISKNFNNKHLISADAARLAHTLMYGFWSWTLDGSPWWPIQHWARFSKPALTLCDDILTSSTHAINLKMCPRSTPSRNLLQSTCFFCKTTALSSFGPLNRLQKGASSFIVHSLRLRSRPPTWQLCTKSTASKGIIWSWIRSCQSISQCKSPRSL